LLFSRRRKLFPLLVFSMSAPPGVECFNTVVFLPTPLSRSKFGTRSSRTRAVLYRSWVPSNVSFSAVQAPPPLVLEAEPVAQGGDLLRGGTKHDSPPTLRLYCFLSIPLALFLRVFPRSPPFSRCIYSAALRYSHALRAIRHQFTPQTFFV